MMRLQTGSICNQHDAQCGHCNTLQQSLRVHFLSNTTSTLPRSLAVTSGFIDEHPFYVFSSSPVGSGDLSPLGHTHVLVADIPRNNSQIDSRQQQAEMTTIGMDS